MIFMTNEPEHKQIKWDTSKNQRGPMWQESYGMDYSGLSVGAVLGNYKVTCISNSGPEYIADLVKIRF